MPAELKTRDQDGALILCWPRPAPRSEPVPAAAMDVGSPSAKPLLPRRIGALAHDLAARVVLGEVGRDFDVDTDQLLSTGRCNAPIALARQVAMYLLHVELGRQMQEVGRLLGRDRSTVSHACAHVEDLRERPRFDARIDAIELAIRARLTMDSAAGEPGHALGA